MLGRIFRMGHSLSDKDRKRLWDEMQSICADISTRSALFQNSMEIDEEEVNDFVFSIERLTSRLQSISHEMMMLSILDEIEEDARC